SSKSRTSEHLLAASARVHVLHERERHADVHVPTCPVESMESPKRRPTAALSDDVIGPGQHTGRAGQSDLRGRLQSDDELGLGGLFPRQVRWLRAFQILSTYVVARRNRSV